MKRATAAALLTTVAVAHALEPPSIAPFSANLPGAELPGGWKARGVGRAPRAEVALVLDGDVTALQVRSDAAARFGDLRLEARA